MKVPLSAIAAGFLAGLACAGPLVAQSCTFADVDAPFQAFLQAQKLPGGAVLVADRQGIFHERYFGDYTAATVVPIASASKLLSAVRILQLIDRGSLDGNAPVSTYLPQFTGDKAAMTVLQMFSHTAGYGGDSGDPLVFNRNLTLAEAVDQIACCKPLPAGYSVGGQFSYGGVSMHIAGRVAEVVGGGDWQAQWLVQIAEPLGITSIDWQGLGATANYGIAGSARSNLRDYGKLLHMLLNRGRGEHNQRMLGSRVIERLQVDAAAGLPVASAPPGVTPPVRYGVGSWLDGIHADPQPGLVHSLGAFGFLPWIDFQNQRFGVFMIRGTAGINSASIPVYRAMLQAIEIELDGATCAPVQRFDAVFSDDLEDG